MIVILNREQQQHEHLEEHTILIILRELQCDCHSNGSVCYSHELSIIRCIANV